MKFSFSLVLVLLLVLNSCKDPGKKELKPDLVKSPAEVDEHVRKDLKILFKKTDSSSRIVVCGDTIFSTPAVADFYRARDFQPLYFKQGVFQKEYYIMRRIIRDAGEYGLLPRDYHWPLIDSIAGLRKDSKTGYSDASRLAQLEILMSDAFFVMANHLHHGRLDPDSLTRVWAPHKLDTNLAVVFQSAINSGKIWKALRGFEPHFLQYIDLKWALRNYREEHKGIKWSVMPDIKKDTAGYMQMVKVRMMEMGFYDTTKKENDSLRLARSLKKFQRAYHLTEDGKIGKEMIKALSYTIQDRIIQLELNIERWRWEKNFGNRIEPVYVWVNLPGFYMRVAEKDTLVLESRIICGDPKHPSPVLKSRIMYFTIYPYWNVPYSIASKEILPRIKWDTAYLRKQRFEVIDWKGNIVDPRTINWRKYNEKNLPYKFRQREGEDNSLGIVKFFFNNKPGVYLHDTNSKKLFKKDVRSLSHGCIRLEEYMEFAKFLVRDDSVKIPKDTLYKWFATPEQRIVNLRKSVPIYIRYFSAEVKNLDDIYFYPDIYGRDEKMKRSLFHLPEPLPEPEPVKKKK